MNAPLKANGIHHVGLQVSDLKHSMRFYVEFLGMEVIQERRTMCFLRCGEQMITLSQAGDGELVNAAKGMDHLALQLEFGGYRSVKEMIEDAGHEVFGSPGDIYFPDPDGYLLQILIPEG